LFLVLLLFPSASWHTFNGLPLSSLPEVAALILILPLIFNGALRRLYSRSLVNGPLPLATLLSVAILTGLIGKVFLFASKADAGFLACHRAEAGPEAPWVCEKSYDTPFSSDSVTRIDDTINFGRSDWHLSFFNSLRFNFYPWEKGNIVRDRLPFASTWRGT